MWCGAHQSDKLKFDHRSNEPGGPNSVTTITGLSGSRCQRGHPRQTLEAVAAKQLTDSYAQLKFEAQNKQKSPPLMERTF